MISSAEGKQGYIQPNDAVNTFASFGSFPDHILVDKNGDLGKKFNASGEVVIKLVSIKSDLSKILFLFLSKSGPFLLRGSKNH